jgi:hypothetical protein
MRLLALALPLLLCAAPAHAAAVGAIVGLDRCGIGGDVDQNTTITSQFGYLAGVQGEIGIGKNIALSLQPRYSTRETKLVTTTRNETELKLKLDYVSVPVVVKFNAMSGRTYVAGGLDLGFLQKAHLSTGGLDRDIKSYFHDTDLGALVGFGVVFPIGSPRLTTEVRYVQGVTNLAERMVGGLPERFHTYGLQLTAGILLPLGGH